MHITDIRTTLVGKHLNDQLWTQIARSRDVVDTLNEDVAAQRFLSDNDGEFLAAHELFTRRITALVGDVWRARSAVDHEVSGDNLLDTPFAAQTYNESVFYPLNESAPRLRVLIAVLTALAEHDRSSALVREAADSDALIRLAEVCENIADLGPATE